MFLGEIGGIDVEEGYVEMEVGIVGGYYYKLGSFGVFRSWGRRGGFFLEFFEGSVLFVFRF